MKSLFAMIFVLLIMGCTADDPYDPMMGGRNPRPGAEKYLSNRSDISDAQKKALLNYEPCSPETLRALVDSPAREVRSLVAANPTIDEAILEKLIHDKESGVRQYVAGNEKAPQSILLKLQNDSNENVRWTLEHNPSWTKNSRSK